MKNKYDHNVTLYKCQRCGSPIEIESDSFYWFNGPDDSNFWCPACEDLPQAAVVGQPAGDLPIELLLPKQFTCKIVPVLEPHELDNGNILFRPYSKRSFLRQYISWVNSNGGKICNLSTNVTVSPSFDAERQIYTRVINYKIYDSCSSADCQFLQSQTIKPAEVKCSAIELICDTKGKYGLCQTGDEAMILQQYLLLTGAEHFPMLLPQASILKGKRRPDFICFVPVTKFQYHKVAVLIDRPGKLLENIKAEDDDYLKEGYLVKRIDVDPSGYGRSYFKIARELILWLQNLK